MRPTCDFQLQVEGFSTQTISPDMDSFLESMRFMLNVGVAARLNPTSSGMTQRNKHVI